MTPNEQTAVEAIKKIKMRMSGELTCFSGDVQDRWNALKRAHDDLDEVVALLEASPTVTVSRWIPVTERLPEVGETVFTYWHDSRFPGSIEGLGMNKLVMTDDGIVWDGYERTEYGEVPECGISHWAPLEGFALPEVPQ